MPIVGAGELRHCLTCNAERRFEWKPEPPSPYPELDGLIMPTVTVSREELARRYPQGEPPGYAFKITEAQDAALEREEAKRAEKPEMKAWGDTDKMSDELDQEARAKNRTASERMAAIHMYPEVDLPICRTENDHDWTPHEGGRLCRRCHGWNAIITL